MSALSPSCKSCGSQPAGPAGYCFACTRVLLAACERGNHAGCELVHLVPAGPRVTCTCACHGECKRGQTLSGECVMYEGHVGPCVDSHGRSTLSDVNQILGRIQ